MFYGVFELATLLAREGMYLFMGAQAPDQQTLWLVGTVALWLIAMYGFAFFLLSKRLDHPGNGIRDEDAADPAAVPSAGDRPTSMQARVEAFCRTYALSAREQEVLVEFVHGYSMESIGRRLSISKDTVKTHVQRIYRKAGVSGKQGLVEFIDGFPLDGSGPESLAP